jgi:hypothetical protein
MAAILHSPTQRERLQEVTSRCRTAAASRHIGPDLPQVIR